MLQNARILAFTVSELLTENQHRRSKNTPTQILVNLSRFESPKKFELDITLASVLNFEGS